MDHPGTAAGTTIYLPVFAPGALLSVGDGHAAQGDGEIAGAGVEVSMQIHISVELHKQSDIRWPRGESADAIWCIGNARPLEQALQHATTEMVRWLRSIWGLDTRTASLILAQAAEYQIGNVCNPVFTVACRLARRHLPNHGS